MKSIIVCVPNPIANKWNSHFRGRMEIMAAAMRDFGFGDVEVTTSANQWDLMQDQSIHQTLIHLGDSYGGPEIGGWNWNEYGRASEDPETYKWWLHGVNQCWESIAKCKNPTALEFPFPDKFKNRASTTLRKPEWQGTPTLELFEAACKRLEDHSIYSEADSAAREFYDPWVDSVVKGGYDGFVLGDSHGLSCWRPGHALIYRKGETLHGATKRGFKAIVESVFKGAAKRFNRGIFNYGNIDLRHHICRFPDVEKTIDDLVNNYIAQILGMELNEVTIAQPFPINDDSRTISLSVMFAPKITNAKGKQVNGPLQPFSGTWAQRDYARRYMSDKLEDRCRLRGWNYLKWPDGFTDHKGCFNPEVMESGRPGATKGRGIHLSPEFYFWDIRNNRQNDYSSLTSHNVENFFS
jgi:hypothetical protein